MINSGTIWSHSCNLKCMYFREMIKYKEPSIHLHAFKTIEERNKVQENGVM